MTGPVSKRLIEIATNNKSASYISANKLSRGLSNCKANHFNINKIEAIPASIPAINAILPATSSRPQEQP